jgi:hypothetical protein
VPIWIWNAIVRMKKKIQFSDTHGTRFADFFGAFLFFCANMQRARYTSPIA